MKRIDSIIIKKIYDSFPDTSYLGEYVDKPQKGDCYRHNAGGNEYKYFRPANPEYRWEDFKRFEALNNDNWYFIGIKAIATISLSNDGKNWISNTIDPGGLWGIESDSGQDYFDEIANDQLNELKIMLTELGFSAKSITIATKNPTWEEV